MVNSGVLVAQTVKHLAYNSGDPGSIPGLGTYPWRRNGNPLQYSCLENPMDGGAWWATVHGVAESRTRLSDFTSLYPVAQLFLILWIMDPFEDLMKARTKFLGEKTPATWTVCMILGGS